MYVHTCPIMQYDWNFHLRLNLYREKCNKISKLLNICRLLTRKISKSAEKMKLVFVTGVVVQFLTFLLFEVDTNQHHVKSGGGDQYLMRPRPAKGFLAVTKLQVITFSVCIFLQYQLQVNNMT